jgi:hypothetical protein
VNAPSSPTHRSSLLANTSAAQCSNSRYRSRRRGAAERGSGSAASVPN